MAVSSSHAAKVATIVRAARGTSRSTASPARNSGSARVSRLRRAAGNAVARPRSSHPSAGCSRDAATASTSPTTTTAIRAQTRATGRLGTSRNASAASSRITNAIPSTRDSVTNTVAVRPARGRRQRFAGTCTRTASPTRSGNRLFAMLDTR